MENELRVETETLELKRCTANVLRGKTNKHFLIVLTR